MPAHARFLARVEDGGPVQVALSHLGKELRGPLHRHILEVDDMRAPLQATDPPGRIATSVLNPVGIDLAREHLRVALLVEDLQAGAIAKLLQLEAVVVVNEGEALLLQAAGDLGRFLREAHEALGIAIGARQAADAWILAVPQLVLGYHGVEVIAHPLVGDMRRDDRQAVVIGDLLQLRRFDRPHPGDLHRLVTDIADLLQRGGDVGRRLEEFAHGVELRGNHGIRHLRILPLPTQQGRAEPTSLHHTFGPYPLTPSPIRRLGVAPMTDWWYTRSRVP